MQLPPGTDIVPLAHASRSRAPIAWTILLVTALLAVVTMTWLGFERGRLSSRLGAADEQLSSAQQSIAATDLTVRRLEGDLDRVRGELASMVETVDSCRQGLRAMVRLWNLHTRELDLAGSGSDAALDAAHSRTEAARAQAQRAIRRCGG